MPGALEFITYEVTGRAAVITLNRPQARNAVNARMTREMARVMARFEADDEVLVGVLTGAGDAFCAGMDLKAFLAGEAEDIVQGPEIKPPAQPRLTGVDMLGSLFSRKGGSKEPLRTGFAGFLRYPRTKPVLAAVNGPALAGGFELVLACDMVLASEKALFGLPEPKVGLFAAAGGAFRLPRRIPAGRAMEMLLTGDPMDAGEALALGLVNRVVAPERLMPEALILVAKVAANAPFALRETYNLARASREMNEAAFWEESAKGWWRILTTADAHEGPRAFVEKRKPVWKG